MRPPQILISPMRENHAGSQDRHVLTGTLTLPDGFLTGRTSTRPASTLPPDGLTAPDSEGCPAPPPTPTPARTLAPTPSSTIQTVQQTPHGLARPRAPIFSLFLRFFCGWPAEIHLNGIQPNPPDLTK